MSTAPLVRISSFSGADYKNEGSSKVKLIFLVSDTPRSLNQTYDFYKYVYLILVTVERSSISKKGSAIILLPQR